MAASCSKKQRVETLERDKNSPIDSIDRSFIGSSNHHREGKER